ncbi:hypothetical protein CYLTODRAFT_458153 [Cylindrobasidium torrendii FP15055 ss-10]|uniref:G-patch domain-containing protein n=1 Tax=Cylindrobasidium torrendii FP15055 ss-10 TaxID=1314674 RepID=A0A0D7AYG0_9AGAR|nr:hypothetical protein CYLTODRAFT_458153 [Cylindrobasidium torrendii FP15055 ss-10]
MPLDGHSYLVAQGWSGTGSGLRNGAISRPITVAQKKTLSGIGKDRDEAFPFWDHVFTAAASSLNIKIYNSDDDSDESDSDEQTSVAPKLARTTTGILSNKRPTTGTAALPSPPASGTSTPNLSLMAQAKREVARRRLYSGFFKGPVLGPDPTFLDAPVQSSEPAAEASTSQPTPGPSPSTSPPPSEKKRKRTPEEKAKRLAEKEEKRERKRRKLEAKAANIQTEDDATAAKAERKKIRKAAKQAAKEESKKAKTGKLPISELDNTNDTGQEKEGKAKPRKDKSMEKKRKRDAKED